MNDFQRLQDDLKIHFNDGKLLQQAFCHRSYLNEKPCPLEGHNERLEFLGDAVIEIVVTKFLYLEYPQSDEGELTSWRASLVNARTLSQVAIDLGFNDYLLLSRGEAKEQGKARQYILANTFEAFVGALYLDKGMDSCYSFLDRHLLGRLPAIIKSGEHRDPKSIFQEEAQKKAGITPSYHVLEETGPDHQKIFVVGVFLNHKLIAQGRGSSKQEAEEEAARAALEIKE
jgi:ribonuclease III